MTVGVVSGFNRSEPISTENGAEIDFKGLLQTSAPINPGNSGGPLIDIDGQVIGMNQSTVKSAYAQGIGFAIPSNTVRSVVASLEKNPGVHQGTDTGFLGIYMAELSAGVKNQIGFTGSCGVAVQQVFSGSPADQAGIQPGDVILQVDGKAFDNVKDLHNYISSKKPGDTIRLNVWSQGMKKFVAIKLIEAPAAQPQTQQQQQAATRRATAVSSGRASLTALRAVAHHDEMKGFLQPRAAAMCLDIETTLLLRRVLWCGSTPMCL